MKKFALLLLCLTLFATQNSNAQITSNVQKDAGYISLSGNAYKEVEPDQATITFAIENTGTTAISAARENNEIANKVVNALKTISEDYNADIKTNNYTVRSNYTKNNEIKKYTVINSVTVITQDIKSIPKFIDVAISNGANRTSNLYYELKDASNVCNELYPNVIKDLKNTAIAVATASDTKYDGIKNISVSCNSGGKYYKRAFLMNADSTSMAEGAPLAPIEVAKIKIDVYVNANFYVK